MSNYRQLTDGTREKLGEVADFAGGLDVYARYRFVDAFEMDSPFFGDSVRTYDLIDVSAGVDFSLIPVWL